MKRPVRQSFNVGRALCLELDAGGDVYVFAHQQLVVHRWNSGKTERHVWGTEPTKFLSSGALMGSDALAVVLWNTGVFREELCILDRQSLERRVELPMKNKARVVGLCASPDGRWLSVVRDHTTPFVDVYAADGRLAQTVSSSGRLLGAAFSEDSQELLTFTEAGLFRQSVEGKKQQRFACELAAWNGTAEVTRREGKLLFAFPGFGATRPAYLFDEAKSKLLRELEDANLHSFGPASGTLVRSTGAEVGITDQLGKKLAGFRRDRRTPLQCARAHPSGFWVAAGGCLEIYDFGQLAEVAASAPAADKKRSPPKMPKLIATSKTDVEQQDRLLEKIWANPDDEAALRIYADWLCEHGAETRGRYIQLMLARGDDMKAQWAKARTLLKRHRGEWLGAARPFVRSWRDSDAVPGFVESVTCEAHQLLAGFDQISKLGPNLEVAITAISKQRRQTEEKLAALPLKRFGRIDLSSNGLDDDSLKTLAPALAGVKRLGLYSNPISAAGLDVLGHRSGPFDELLFHPYHRAPSPLAEYVKVLGEAPAFRALRRLSFGGLAQLPGGGELMAGLRKKLKHLEDVQL